MSRRPERGGGGEQNVPSQNDNNKLFASHTSITRHSRELQSVAVEET